MLDTLENYGERSLLKIHEGMPNLTEWEKWMRGGNGGIKGGRHIMLL